MNNGKKFYTGSFTEIFEDHQYAINNIEITKWQGVCSCGHSTPVMNNNKLIWVDRNSHLAYVLEESLVVWSWDEDWS